MSLGPIEGFTSIPSFRTSIKFLKELDQRVAGEALASIPARRALHTEIQRHITCIKEAVDDPRQIIPTDSSEVEEALQTLQTVREEKVDLRRQLQEAIKVVELAQVRLGVAKSRSRVGNYLTWASSFLPSWARNIEPAEATCQSIDTALGERRVMNEVMHNKLLKLFRKSEEIPNAEQIRQAFEHLLKEVVMARTVTLKLISEDKVVHMSRPEYASLNEAYANACMLIAQDLGVKGQEYINFVQDLYDLALPLNTQVHTDGIFLGLFEARLDLPELTRDTTVETEKNFFNRLEGQLKTLALSRGERLLRNYYIPIELNTADAIEAYHDKCLMDNKDFDPKVEDAIRERHGYLTRNTDNLLQKCIWERRILNEKGGYESLVRVVGFMSESGAKTEMRIMLDLTDVAILNKEQTLDVMKFIRDVDDELRVMIPCIEACRQDRRKSPYQELKNLVQLYEGQGENLRRAKDILDKLEAIDWLKTDADKDNFLKGIFNFVFEINRAMALAILTV